jgi:hypothetical protein
MAFVARSSFQDSLKQVRSAPVEPCNAAAIQQAAAPPPPKPVRPAVAQQEGIPSVAEYRGTSAAANVKATRNYSTDAKHTSLPMNETTTTHSAHRKPNDITAHQTNALLTGSGSLFNKANVSTSKGWSQGRFN